MEQEGRHRVDLRAVSRERQFSDPHINILQRLLNGETIKDMRKPMNNKESLAFGRQLQSLVNRYLEIKKLGEGEISRDEAFAGAIEICIERGLLTPPPKPQDISES